MDLFSVIALIVITALGAFALGLWARPRTENDEVDFARNADLNRRAESIEQQERSLRSRVVNLDGWESRLNSQSIAIRNRTIALNKREHELNLREAETAFGDADGFARLPLTEKIRRVNEIELKRLGEERDRIVRSRPLTAHEALARQQRIERADREMARAQGVRADYEVGGTNQLATNVALGAMMGGAIGAPAPTCDLNPAWGARSADTSSSGDTASSGSE